MYKPGILLAKKETTLEHEISAKGEVEEGEPSKKSHKDDLGNFIDKINKRQVKDIDDKKPPLTASSYQRLNSILSISALSVLAVILSQMLGYQFGGKYWSYIGSNFQAFRALTTSIFGAFGTFKTTIWRWE